MSIHIEAEQGEIADKILLPGDPLRTKLITEDFLEDAVCLNNVRGILGFTRTYKDERVSVMGTGMGMPSISIYATELAQFCGVKKLIRVGTAGSLDKDVHVREFALAQAAATASSVIKDEWSQYGFPQVIDFTLFDKAYHIAQGLEVTTHVSGVLFVDAFYSDFAKDDVKLGQLGVKTVEMETTALHYLAAECGVQVLGIMMTSGSLVADEDTTAQGRQTTFTDMMKVGLEALIVD